MNITLKNLHEATEYDVVKQVGTHLLRQNKRSENVDGVCMYRGQDGLKCAAGCLIADDEYQGRFEEESWGTLVCEMLVPESHRLIIQELQEIHDGESPRDWAFFLRRLCDARGLDSGWIREVLNERG